MFALGYADARELFCAVRDAAREAERVRRSIERMEAAEGVRAQGYEPATSHSRGDANGMARTDARIDYEALTARRVEEDYQLVDTACRAIYGEGEDGRGGVCALMGAAVADCMWWRFCAAASWAEVAAACGYSKSQARRLVVQGLDAVDFFGWANLMGGEGAATE